MFEAMIQTKRLIWSRIRALCWRMRGATIAGKVNVAAGCRVDHPAGVCIKTRVTLEGDVWIKLVHDSARLMIGEFSFLGRGTELDVAQQVTIGANVLIAPRVFITDHSHNCAVDQPINQQGCISQPVVIGNDVWIGTGVTILSGVTIGDGAVIGAGAVVNRNVPANEIWAGVPARKIRER